MNRVLALLIFVAAVIAVPTPSKTTSKKAFAAKAKGHGKPAPAEAMKKAARKWGFDITITEPELDKRHSGWDEAYPQGSSAPAWEAALQSWLFSESTAYLVNSASAVPWSASASVAWSSATGSASAVPILSSGFRSSVVPSSAPRSSAPVPSATSPPQSESSAPSSGGNESGEVSADPEENESMYLSPVDIAGQKLELDFDTGSSDLWVYSPDSGSSATFFDPSKSSTWTVYQGGSWEISYGDGSSASGTVGFDEVTIGGLTAKKQAIELADQVSSSFQTDASTDGLLGLAFSSINQVRPQPQKTFFENIMGDLEQPLFTTDLEEDNSGTYEFGKIDDSKHTGSINYTPVNNGDGFWGIESQSYTIGGSQQACGTCSKTIVDTGTSLLIMDDDIAAAYYEQVNGAQLSNSYGGYVYPCGTTLPDFGIAIGSGYTAVIKGADMTYAQAESGLCFGGIQPGGTQAGYNILGDVLLKQFFAVFDGGNMQFGIAPKP